MKAVRTLAGTGLVCLGLIFASTLPARAQESNNYVGSKPCAECHEKEYANYTAYSKKAKSSRSLHIMASDLSEAELESCFTCHTTGYGQPGGFVSFEKTPHLADAGCEVCHGPGQQHVVSGGDPDLIRGDLSIRDCESCHNEERVASFNFKPMLYGGAH